MKKKMANTANMLLEKLYAELDTWMGHALNEQTIKPSTLRHIELVCEVIEDMHELEDGGYEHDEWEHSHDGPHHDERHRDNPRKYHKRRSGSY